MPESRIHQLTVHELLELLRKKKVSAVDATRACLARIEAVEPKVKAFITLTPEAALEQAAAADAARAAGDDRPLLGVPVGVKDIIATAGVRTTCGSKILENFVPTYDATVTQKLKDAGAVIIGKLNMDEFAMGSSTERSGFFPTRNPWDLERIPGGSSGGSAAAVAADECFASLGTDTGGSIRQPAACCGVVGIKPTYGRVSRFGVVAFASSLDQVGPITKDVTDAALMLEVLAGHDPADSTSVPTPAPRYRDALGHGVKGLKVGIPKEYFGAGLDPEVEKLVRAAVGKLGELGAEVVEISLPHTDYGVACYYIIAPAEASSNLARYDGARYGVRSGDAGNLIEMYKNSRDRGLGPEVKRRILIGTYTLSAGYYDAYYRKASQARTLIKRDFEAAFEKVDVIATPAMPTPPWKIGERVDDPVAMYLSDVLTLSVNLAGLPAMSVPCGFTGSGLPVGLQLLARHFNEETLFQAGYTYEQAGNWRTKPKI